ncbi:MAG: glycosyltransferase [Planctomycetota bacterium]
MRVLMLGWEFPPHISGGLGTACFGLTQGLSHHDVDVLFVVPRARGDEDQRFVQVVGANQVPIYEIVREERQAERAESTRRTKLARRRARAQKKTSPPKPGDPADAEAWERTIESLEILEIDSLLSPYMSEQAYLERRKQHSERVESKSAAQAQAEAAVEDLKQLLAPYREVAGGVAGGALEAAENLVSRGTLEFSGFYGPDLMSEVARFALAVGHIARTQTFDVIHAHDWMTVPAGLVAARITRKPLVVHVHACEYDRSGEHVNSRVRDIEQLGLDGADRVVCVSHYTKNIVRTRYRVDPAKLRVVHNAVTHSQQVEILHVEKPIEEPIVLFLGRVTFQKGPDYFLEAAARVVKKDPHVKFVMSGSGDMLPVMIERSARLGLARHMHFTGFLKGADVERMYAMADIYVMPSVSEPFGISPLEAMALDTPVIMSRQSGVSEILRNALKVDFWDVDDMANKILALLRYSALREQLVEEGRDEIQNIRWDYPAGLVRDIYRELVA